jgi:D-cysteine desulfhydrase family pyridoxal phosphate-dependent enzyme
MSLCHDLPRVSLCSILPTPLEEAPRLSKALGDVHLLVKREDLTGLATGGNKIRNLEYIFGEVLEQGCDAVITTAGVQSNMCRATAATTARLGMGCVLLLRGTGEETEQGNLLLDRLLGADVRFIPTKDPYDERVTSWLDDARQELESQGRQPYILHLTGITSTLATCAYVDGAQELATQFSSLGRVPEWLYVTVGSGITMAGLVLGLKHLNLPTRVVGVSASSAADFLVSRVVDYANCAAERLGLDTRISENEFDLLDEYVGPGYGKSYPDVIETIRLAAREEGLLLDPVYTGKCMTALRDQISRDHIVNGESVVFLHSGGVPNLFDQAEVVRRDIR